MGSSYICCDEKKKTPDEIQLNGNNDKTTETNLTNRKTSKAPQNGFILDFEEVKEEVNEYRKHAPKRNHSSFVIKPVQYKMNNPVKDVLKRANSALKNASEYKKYLEERLTQFSKKKPTVCIKKFSPEEQSAWLAKQGRERLENPLCLSDSQRDKTSTTIDFCEAKQKSSKSIVDVSTTNSSSIILFKKKSKKPVEIINQPFSDSHLAFIKKILFDEEILFDEMDESTM